MYFLSHQYAYQNLLNQPFKYKIGWFNIKLDGSVSIFKFLLKITNKFCCKKREGLNPNLNITYKFCKKKSRLGIITVACRV